MNILDGVDIGTSLSCRFAILVAIVTVVRFLFWPTKSFNIVYGQALDSIAGATNVVGSRLGIHCTVEQDGLFARPHLGCE